MKVLKAMAGTPKCEDCKSWKHKQSGIVAFCMLDYAKPFMSHGIRNYCDGFVALSPSTPKEPQP